MRTARRTPSVPARAGSRPASRRRQALLLALLATLSLALLIGAAPAGAVISGSFGLQGRSEAAVKAEPLQYHGGPVLHSSDSYAIYWDPTGSYRGDWKRLINGYFQNVGAASKTLGDVFALNGQYGDAAGGAVNQSTFRGSYTDTDEYPTSGNCTAAATVACLTNQQIQAELQHVIASGALPGASGPAVYYLLTPPGVTVCTAGPASNCSVSTSTPANGICGYHSAINPGSANPVIYAVQPWVAGNAGLIIEAENPLKTSAATEDVLACQASGTQLEEPNQLVGVNPFGNYAEGLADVIINDLSIEQSNVVVDPLLNGWYQTATSAEQADMCQWNFGPPPKTAPTEQEGTNAGERANETINGHTYFTQWAFDSTWLTSGKGYFCFSADSLEPHFTAPNPVNSGDVVGFDATESDITLDANVKGLPPSEPFIAPIYTWDFGDGTVVSGTSDASVFHSYTYGGLYDVTLTITDSGRNKESFNENITVVGPTAPGAPGPGASGQATAGQSTAGTSSSGSGSGAGTAGGAAKGKPVATEAVASNSLASVLKGGLVIRYSVNEQVAGRFEVLLASSIARQLGLHGARATGLAKGTPAQTVIAKAVLVTTRGARDTYRIHFSKTIAARLKRLRKVSLMLRMVVHNASANSTTVLNKVTLKN